MLVLISMNQTSGFQPSVELTSYSIGQNVCIDIAKGSIHDKASWKY